MSPDEINGQQQESAAEDILAGIGTDRIVKTRECRDQVQCTFFRGEDNTCRIYQRRPFECRLYPFLLLKKAGGPALGAHLSCPYVQEKRHEDIFTDHVEALKAYFRKDEGRRFLMKNPALVCDYPGYEREIEHLFALE
jgi:Fe-S-cluster containining protein